jgi:hypothetical protein
MNYTITLTNTEKLAMEYIALNPQEWVENLVKERARIAIDEIVKIAIEKFLEVNETIPGSKDEIVAAAFENGWVKTIEEISNNQTMGN